MKQCGLGEQIIPIAVRLFSELLRCDFRVQIDDGRTTGDALQANILGQIEGGWITLICNRLDHRLFSDSREILSDT